MKLPDKTESGMTKNCDNVSARLQAFNRELELRRAEAEAANRSKTEFLANMAHEFRTPLNAILGFADLMLMDLAGPITEKQKEYLNDITAAGNHLLTLINDILALSKADAGNTVLEPGDCEIKELIEGSPVMFREKALKHDLRVSSELDQPQVP